MINDLIWDVLIDSIKSNSDQDMVNRTMRSYIISELAKDWLCRKVLGLPEGVFEVRVGLRRWSVNP